MSFQNFESFPNQHPAADAAAAAAGAPAPADTAMAGQPDPATAQFQGPPPEAAAGPVPQQVNEGKTTLWYATGFQLRSFLTVLGWVSLNRGLTRTLFATSGSRWASRSMSR